jgi:hypothetical protein
MTVREVLCKARKLISNKANWCQWALHMGDQHCALGALEHVSGTRHGPEMETLRAAAKELYGSSIVTVNDSHGYEATLKMFDRAIEMACEKEDGE